MTVTTLESVKHAIRALNLDAEDVQNSPVDLINVWSEAEQRAPAATVFHNDELHKFEWGHQWEHSVPDTLTAHAVAIAVERTLHGNAVDEPRSE